VSGLATPGSNAGAARGEATRHLQNSLMDLELSAAERGQHCAAQAASQRSGFVLMKRFARRRHHALRGDHETVFSHPGRRFTTPATWRERPNAFTSPTKAVAVTDAVAGRIVFRRPVPG
jgi:hypothetical protein